MPEHCQPAGKELPWEFEIRESPHNIPSSPSGQPTQTAGDRPINLTATKKPEDDDDPKGSLVDPSQIPDDDGYDPYDTYKFHHKLNFPTNLKSITYEKFPTII